MTTNDEDRKAAEEWSQNRFGHVAIRSHGGEPRPHPCIDAFLAGVAHARRWIPVAERLPREGQCIIGAYKGRCVVFGEFNTRNGEPRFTMCEPSMLGTIDPVMYGCSITHWMPLPPEPEGGNE